MSKTPIFLVTRAEPEANDTARLVRLRGGEAVLAPLRAVAPLMSPVPSIDPGLVLATSANAFRYGLPLPMQWRARPLWVVGEKTEAVARAVGFDAPRAIAGTVEALLGALEIGPADNALYLAGEPRKPDIEAWFAERGRTLTVWPRYRMVDVETLPDSARTALQAGHIDAILHYSAESARSFFRLSEGAGLRDAAARPHQIVLSEAVAAVVLREVGHGASIMRAKLPRGDAMIDAAFAALR